MSTSNNQSPSKKSETTTGASAKKTKEHPTDAENDPELQASATKRQKTDEVKASTKGTEDKKSGSKADAKKKRNIIQEAGDDEDSEDFHAAGDVEDSFDSDFGEPESPEDLEKDDDEFDVEAYLKWRQENPDAQTPPRKGGDDEEEDEEDDEDYDDEDDEGDDDGEDDDDDDGEQ